jgi:hypothetical protein
MADQRIEKEFHEQVWGTANASSAMERAVSEGRDLAYSLLRLAGPDSAEAAHANHWLDNFGRDPAKEAR